MNVRTRWLLVGIALLALGSPRTATSQEPPADDPNQPRVIRLTLSPAPEPVPALRHELLPNTTERKPGNAATYYYRSVITAKMIPEELLKEESRWFAEFGDDAYRKVPKERLQAWLDAHQRALDEFRRATFRERCDWDLRTHDLRGGDAVNYTIEEFQQLRWLMRPLVQRIRLAIEAGKHDEALEGMRTGFQSARHVAMQPSVICVLIGVAFIHQTNERLEQWIDSPGSPNLYWALATLPRPLVSFRDAIDQERAMPERLFPFLKDAETSSRSVDEWQRLFVETIEQLAQWSGTSTPGKNSAWQNQAAAVALAARGYSPAKRELEAAGFDRERLAKMPVAQVVAIHAARTTRRLYDDMLKSYYLSYPQSLAWSEKMNRQWIESRTGGNAAASVEIFPISQLMLPSMAMALRAEVRAERYLSALQTLEAIRMHLAASGGKLPASLDEITVVPVPLNPATQQPFSYHLDGDQAVLEVPAASGEPALYGRRYVLRSRAK